MSKQSEKKQPYTVDGKDMNRTSHNLTVGLLAHVDAGKTTLAESVLYLTGAIRRAGRVDHADAFLDTYELEKERGITVFSKQAQCTLGDWQITLLDTPGHADFSAEMERTLQVLDYAVFVVSAPDGVRGQVETLWQLLESFHIPTFIFVNKMDQEGTDRDSILAQLKGQLSDDCIDFAPLQGLSGCGSEAALQRFYEDLAVRDEGLMDNYLRTGRIEKEDTGRLIKNRRIFPCFFGSALKMTGVEDLLSAFEQYAIPVEYPAQFGARVYKISRDAKGERLTHLKITGGCLRIRDAVAEEADMQTWEEKISQIRIYSGSGYQTVEEAPAGCVCAVTGLTHSFCGEGFGTESGRKVIPSHFSPVLTYRVQLSTDCDPHVMLKNLRELEEEEPQLHIVWVETHSEIQVQVMGDVQAEIFCRMVRDRFGTEVQLEDGSIIYKETVAAPVEGIGHFEPLRHYAEVHLLLEPGPEGSGIVYSDACDDTVLDKSCRNLILAQLAQKRHVGVLTGSELTDVKITVVAGRAHLKHTEGGDFRQAAWRAVRQGLMKADSILLEPVYDFVLDVPTPVIGRAMSDMRRRCATFDTPRTEGDRSVLSGIVPASELGDYGREVTSYSHGLGSLSVCLHGYMPCHNAEEVISSAGYDPETDVDNPSCSVFCSHGAGYVVPWYEVDDLAHVSSGLVLREQSEDDAPAKSPEDDWRARSDRYEQQLAADRELREIFERTYGPVKPRPARQMKSPKEEEEWWEEIAQDESDCSSPEPDAVSGAAAGQNTAEGTVSGAQSPEQKKHDRKHDVRKDTGKALDDEYLLVDGYNVIFGWDELNELSRTSLDAARTRLMDMLSNYQGYRGMKLILIFDAYKVEGAAGEYFRYHNIDVIYTKEDEKADACIERLAHEIGRKHTVTVATSDNLEQVTVMSSGARRLSARELMKDVEEASEQMRREYIGRDSGSKNLLIHQASDEMAEWMQDVRLGLRSPDDGV